MTTFPVRMVAAGLILAAPLYATGTLAQQTMESQAPQATISISADGEATLVPDMATVSMAVVSEADAADAALSENSAAMKKVMAALKEAGIADKDMQTDNFSINPRYKQIKTDDGMTNEINGYQVRNGLNVKVRNLSNLGAVLDQSIKLGVNSGGGISFSNSDPSGAENEARKEAVSNAIAKAETLAEAAGVKLGDVLSITENSSMPQPVMFRAEAMMVKSDGGAPVAAGENTYSVTVNMTFAIEQ